MSRRRTKPESSSVAGEFFTVRVVCTDRGRHTPVAFGHVEVFGDGTTQEHLRRDRFFVDADPDWSDPAAALKAIEGQHFTSTLRCPRCRPARNVPLTQARIEVIFRGLAAAGQGKLDLSALDTVGML